MRGDISNLSLSESFRAARCMIIQHFWYTHTRLLHTYRGGTHAHSSQLVTVRGDLVQVEIGDAQGVCECGFRLWRDNSARTILITLYLDLLFFP